MFLEITNKMNWVKYIKTELKYVYALDKPMTYFDMLIRRNPRKQTVKNTRRENKYPKITLYIDCTSQHIKKFCLLLIIFGWTLFDFKHIKYISL